jgi:hypothetical protein
MVSTNCFNPTTMDDFMGDEDGLIPQYANDPQGLALWLHARDTYLEFHDTLGMHSWDDDDGDITVYAHVGGTPNAGHTPGCGIEFHDTFVGLDVVAHEFTHGIVSNGSGLVYQGQSGVIDESLADSLAATVVDKGDWLHGEDRMGGGGANRSLADPTNGQCGPPANPSPCGDPDRMSASSTRPATTAACTPTAGFSTRPPSSCPTAVSSTAVPWSGWVDTRRPTSWGPWPGISRRPPRPSTTRGTRRSIR